MGSHPGAEGYYWKLTKFQPRPWNAIVTMNEDALHSDDDDLETDADEDDIVSPENISPSDKKLEKEYESGRLRVVQDRNDFFLPHVVDFVNVRQWGNLRPEYQRRLRWSTEKKSRLIESFLMNVPVPPVFLYDSMGTKLEVLDGQQRINAVVEFLTGRFELEKLKIWPTLNGRSFIRLPPALRRGLNRAKLSAITLVIEPKSEEIGSVDLRAQVFDRLNTGGEKLNPQELRNCLYSGPFNRLVVQLSGLDMFTKAWDIPPRKDHTLSDGSYDETLRSNKLFSTMADCQIVLRYFAFKDDKYVLGSTRSILDNCMGRFRNSDEAAIHSKNKEFTDALGTAIEIFGDRAFRIGATGRSKGRLSRPLFDAKMIAIHRLIPRKAALIRNKAKIVQAIEKLTQEGTESYETIVGRPNTAAAIQKRISVVEKAMRDALA